MPDVTQRRHSAARKGARTARPRETGAQGCAMALSFVIAGLDPAIHAAKRHDNSYDRCSWRIVMDRWVKAGDDDGVIGAGRENSLSSLSFIFAH
jgi:hypothetical protein